MKTRVPRIFCIAYRRNVRTDMQIENKQKKNEAFLFILPDFTYNLDVKHCISLLPSLKLERANSGALDSYHFDIISSNIPHYMILF
jgi:hypothetical protein